MMINDVNPAAEEVKEEGAEGAEAPASEEAAA